jgi:hypothetical protein
MSDELNMDEMWEGGIDQDELKRGAADLLLPVATYTTVPALTLTFNEEPGKFDGRPAGSVARYFGQIERHANEKDVEKGLATKEGEIIGRGAIGFGISPLRVNSKDRDGKDTGRPDRAFRLWMNAVAAYKIAYGAEPQAKSDVLNFVRDYPVRIRVGQYGVPTENNPEPDIDPGNNVLAISAVK